MSQKNIAIKFGIISDTVSSIKVGRTWKHVTLENSQITQNNATLVQDTQTEDAST